MVNARTCLDCGRSGPPEEFAKHAGSKFGRSNVCLECAKKRFREYSRRQRERLGYEGKLADNMRVAARFSRLQYAAKVGGRLAMPKPVPCSLTLEQYAALVTQPCHYCGGALSRTGHGLDRKEPGGPYSIENVVPCCAHCNSVKGNNFTYEQMMALGKTNAA